MNVSLQNIDKVSALLTVKLEKADYQEKVDKSLKKLRQKAQVPGFRPGMVPMSLVKKMYGKSVIAEEVNKALSEAVYKYIQDNNVSILGEPLPNEDKQPDIDFDTMEEFEFLFDIALAPEFKAEVSTKDKVDYYLIDVTEDMVNNQVKAYTQRNGKYEQVDVYEDNDMPMPQEFRYVYNVASGAFDSNYRYGEELSALEDYDPGIEAQKWIDSFKV